MNGKPWEPEIRTIYLPEHINACVMVVVGDADIVPEKEELPIRIPETIIAMKSKGYGEDKWVYFYGNWRERVADYLSSKLREKILRGSVTSAKTEEE